MLVELEPEMLALLKAAPFAPLIRQFDTMPDVDDEDMIKRFGVDPPAIYVSVGDARRADTAREYMVPAVLVVVVRHAKSEKEARAGDAKTPGAYALVDAIANYVHQNTTANYSLTVEAARWMRSTMIRDAGLAVCTVDVAALTTLGMPVDLATVDDFITFFAQYDITPFAAPGEHQKWLQEPTPDYSESQPKATDEVTLPTT